MGGAMMAHIRFLMMALLTLGATVPAAAQTAPLPFGLTGLNPGIPMKDARERLAALAPLLVPPAQPQIPGTYIAWTDDNAANAAPYRWRNCSFTVTLFEARGAESGVSAMRQILLQASGDASPACLADIQAELSSRLGPGTANPKIFGKIPGEKLSWHLPTFSVFFVKPDKPRPVRPLASILDDDVAGGPAVVRISGSEGFIVELSHGVAR
jgi:hypothetical protein